MEIRKEDVIMFNLAYKDNCGTPSGVLIPMAEGVTYVPGVALDEKGEVASGETKPAYICAGSGAGVLDGEILAHRIYDDMVFETVLTADGSALKVGDKVTLSEDGKGVTATTGGSAEIVEIINSANGGAVRVRF